MIKKVYQSPSILFLCIWECLYMTEMDNSVLMVVSDSYLWQLILLCEDSTLTTQSDWITLYFKPPSFAFVINIHTFYKHNNVYNSFFKSGVKHFSTVKRPQMEWESLDAWYLGELLLYLWCRWKCWLQFRATVLSLFLLWWGLIIN